MDTDNLDMLSALFQVQAEQEKELGYDIEHMSNIERSAYIKEYTQHIDHELHEMLQELPYFKSWKQYGTYDLVKAKQEFVDALKFFINVALALGYTPATLLGAFITKTAECYNRLHSPEYKKCVENEDDSTN